MSETKRAIVARFDPEERAAMCGFLEDRGYAVTAVESGRDALNQVREQLPDLLVADGVLPGISGFELCRQARDYAQPKTFPVVLILEEEDKYGRGRARADGVDLVLSQPLLPEDLEEIPLASVQETEQVDSVLSGSPGTSDRFLKELLKSSSSRNDPITTRISDPLTGLHHKAFITMRLEEEFKKARRYGQPLSVLLVEVENFADTVRTHGKSVAHEMLLEVAGIFLCESRDVDCAGRVDEARFMLLLPSTSLSGARLMADRVFQQVCSRSVYANGEEIQVRASVGIAALPSEEFDSVEEFLERALRAMRTAANLGGNRICAWGDGAVVEKA
ncbi:MAG: diguanylate cyclase [Planctomycetota bacterium]